MIRKCEKNSFLSFFLLSFFCRFAFCKTTFVFRRSRFFVFLLLRKLGRLSGGKRKMWIFRFLFEISFLVSHSLFGGKIKKSSAYIFTFRLFVGSCCFCCRGKSWQKCAAADLDTVCEGSAGGPFPAAFWVGGDVNVYNHFIMTSCLTDFAG